jgi:hypothetical protein
MKAESATHAAAEMYEGSRAELDELVAHLDPLPPQAGALFAIGLGEDVRPEGRCVAGGGLMVDGKLIHLVAFPASKPGRPTKREPVEEVF